MVCVEWRIVTIIDSSHFYSIVLYYFLINNSATPKPTKRMDHTGNDAPIPDWTIPRSSNIFSLNKRMSATTNNKKPGSIPDFALPPCSIKPNEMIKIKIPSSFGQSFKV